MFKIVLYYLKCCKIPYKNINKIFPRIPLCKNLSWKWSLVRQCSNCVRGCNDVVVKKGCHSWAPMSHISFRIRKKREQQQTYSTRLYVWKINFTTLFIATARDVLYRGYQSQSGIQSISHLGYIWLKHSTMLFTCFFQNPGDFCVPVLSSPHESCSVQVSSGTAVST